jgi:hypothetical protein
VERIRKRLARDLIADVRAVDARITHNTTQLAEVVQTTGSTLTTVDGIGPVLAGRILGRTRRASRFATGSQFAAYTGTAPIEVSSAERARHRLSRAGDRQLNAALHLAAVTQVGMRRSDGRAYYDRKIAEGKTHSEALRCLKRQLAEHVWRTMIRDEHRRQRPQNKRRAREDTRGRLYNPARLAKPRQPALRTSHFPDPPTTSLRPSATRPVDRHRGTPQALHYAYLKRA